MNYKFCSLFKQRAKKVILCLIQPTQSSRVIALAETEILDKRLS